MKDELLFDVMNWNDETKVSSTCLRYTFGFGYITSELGNRLLTKKIISAKTQYWYFVLSHHFFDTIRGKVKFTKIFVHLHLFMCGRCFEYAGGNIAFI